MTGQEFRQLREELGVSQTEIASKQNCTPAYISLIETRDNGQAVMSDMLEGKLVIILRRLAGQRVDAAMKVMGL